jgi:sterol desaturase/sphingolipid hydroxylase (fatty acid hydroxylase superfamily)
LQNKWEFSVILVAIFFAFTALEFFFGGWRETSLAETLKLKKTNWWDIFSTLASFSGFQKTLSNLFSWGLLGAIVLLMRKHDGSLLSGVPFWPRVVLGIVTFDFLLYWTHRLMHENNVLWNLHVYHHSATRVNVLSDYRVHPLDYLLLYPAVLTVIMLVFSREMQNSWAYAWIEVVPGLIAHARIDTDFGWVGKYLIVSPRYHHLHHSKNLTMNTNYAHFFVIWDRVFGTYTEPTYSIHDIEQGLKDNYFETQHPLRAFLKPVFDLYKAPLALFKKFITR